MEISQLNRKLCDTADLLFKSLSLVVARLDETNANLCVLRERHEYLEAILRDYQPFTRKEMSEYFGFSLKTIDRKLQTGDVLKLEDGLYALNPARKHDFSKFAGTRKVKQPETDWRAFKGRITMGEIIEYLNPDRDLISSLDAGKSK